MIRKLKFWKKFIVTLIVVGLLSITLSGCGSSSNTAQNTETEETWTWRLQNNYPPGDQTWDVQMPMLVDAIEKATNGRVKIECYTPGSLCPEEQTAMSVSKGLFEAAVIGPVDCASLVPAAYAEYGIPFYWETGQDVYDNFYKYGLIDFLREEYDKAGLHYACPVANGAYSLMTNFKFEGPDDLKGKKIRAVLNYGEYMKQLGASPVTIPGGDIYMAMKLGTVDGCVYTIGELENGKLKEVVKYVMVQPASGSAAVNMIINKKAWDALPADLQESIDKALQDAYMEVYAADLEIDENAIEKAKEYGVQFIEITPENMKGFWEAGIRAAEEVIKAHPESAKGMELIKKWHQENKE